jgi:hypothetical protein
VEIGDDDDLNAKEMGNPEPIAVQEIVAEEMKDREPAAKKPGVHDWYVEPDGVVSNITQRICSDPSDQGPELPAQCPGQDVRRSRTRTGNDRVPRGRCHLGHHETWHQTVSDQNRHSVAHVRLNPCFQRSFKSACRWRLWMPSKSGGVQGVNVGEWFSNRNYFKSQLKVVEVFQRGERSDRWAADQRPALARSQRWGVVSIRNVRSGAKISRRMLAKFPSISLVVQGIPSNPGRTPAGSDAASRVPGQLLFRARQPRKLYVQRVDGFGGGFSLGHWRPHGGGRWWRELPAGSVVATEGPAAIGAQASQLIWGFIE